MGASLGATLSGPFRELAGLGSYNIDKVIDIGGGEFVGVVG